MSKRHVAAGCLLLGLVASLSACESRDDHEIKARIRSIFDNPGSARFSKITYYRQGDARLACVMVNHANGWGEPLPPMRFDAWYFFDRHFWNAGPSTGDPKLSCADFIENELHPRPAEPPPKLDRSGADGFKVAPVADPSTLLTGCDAEACRWSEVTQREVSPIPGGARHALVLIHGASPARDHDSGHVRWDSQAHQVTVDCSLTHPAVMVGDQRDELELNAAGSDIPGVLNGSYALYAGECHPEARNLDPDDLAKRYGYRAGGAAPAPVQGGADAQATPRQVQRQLDPAATTPAHSEVDATELARRAQQQGMAACREAYDRVYAVYIDHPTKEGGDAVTRAQAVRNSCEAAAQRGDPAR